jgi:hypothetical protein
MRKIDGLFPRQDVTPQSLGSLPQTYAWHLAWTYFTFALVFRRSAQYFFIRALTTFRAAADIWRPRCWTRLIDRATVRRVAGSFSSGKLSQTISAQSVRSSRHAAFSQPTMPHRSCLRPCPQCPRVAVLLLLWLALDQKQIDHCRHTGHSARHCSARRLSITAPME